MLSIGLGLALCLGSSGCVTQRTINLAQGYEYHEVIPVRFLGLDEEKPRTRPEYYVLLPLAFVADVLSSPVQIWEWRTDYHACKSTV